MFEIQKARKPKRLTGKYPASARFWVQIKKTSSCWAWTGTPDRDGYGRLKINNKDIKAHRYAWMLRHETEIPLGYNICHSCDNRLCVNPDHLFLGTNLDNIQDRTNKQRSAKGIKNGRSKLTPSQVREIREKRLTGVSGLALAKEFKVTNALIYRIAKRETWRHII